MNSKKTGEFIAQLRKNKKITQNELADLLGVTNKAISRWETGEGYPEVTLLPRLAIILGVSVDEILNGEKKNQLVENNPRKIAFKFENLFYISSLVLIASLLIAIAVAYYSFYEWLGLVCLVLGVVGSIIIYVMGRYGYLRDSNYTTDDKRYIFTYSSIYYYIILFVLFAYSPLIFKDPNLMGLGEVPEKAILSFSNYIFDFVCMIFISTIFFLIVNTIHRIIVLKYKINLKMLNIPISLVFGFIIYNLEESVIYTRFNEGSLGIEAHILIWILLILLILNKELDKLIRFGLKVLPIAIVSNFLIMVGVETMKDLYIGKLIVYGGVTLIYLIYLIYLRLSNKTDNNNLLRYGIVIPLYFMLRVITDLAMIANLNGAQNEALIDITFKLFIYAVFVIVIIVINRLSKNKVDIIN